MRKLEIGTTFSSFISAFGLEEACKQIRACGFDCVDYSLIQGDEDKQWLFTDDESAIRAYCDNVNAKMAGAGLRISQTHAPYYLYNNPDEYLDKTFCLQYINAIKATAWLGVKYLVVHPVLVREGKETAYANEDSYALSLEYNLKFFSYLKPYALQYGVTIAIENTCGTNALRYRGIPACFSSAEKMKFLVDRLGEGFCVCLDTGHAFYSAESPAHFARKLGPYLKVLHVHDNDGRLDQHIPLTFGYIDWKDFVSALEEIDFEGVFSLENSYTQFTKDPAHMTALATLCATISKTLLQGGENDA